LWRGGGGCNVQVKIYGTVPGVYVGKYPPPGGRGADVICEKNIKMGSKEGGKCKRKFKKGERKRENGK
jgi:hypothetical protein